MKRLLLPLALALAVCARSEPVDLGTHGTLNLAVPKGWKHSVSSQPGLGVTLRLTPPEGVNAQGLITVLFVPQGETSARADVDEKVLLAADNYVDQSVEKKKELRSFNLKGGAYGSYCFFTDASLVGQAPAPEQFKAVASGIVWFNPQVSAVVTLLTDSEKGDDFSAMLACVASATLTPR